jgi:CMP/dCMP kinase
VTDGDYCIAIDGPAAAGKSTIGRQIAVRLGCRYLDTGLMYRAVTLLALQRGIDPGDAAGLTGIAAETSFDVFRTADDRLLVDGTPMRDDLRTPLVDASVSVVSAHPEVREVLVEHQRRLARHGCIVMVGRDIGTVVLPDAPVKLWVTASPRTRAERRNHERIEPHDERTIQQEMARIVERDRTDSTRAASPLRQADDAIVVETDGETPEQTVHRAVELVKRRLRELSGPDPAVT